MKDSKGNPAIIFFDTETTGLKPGNICQLTYIIANEDGVKAKNFFFKVDYVSPHAAKVHGFTKETLDKLSNGKRFNEFSKEVFEDFDSADYIVGHNVSFDKTFLDKELERSRKFLANKDYFCTMWHFKDAIGKKPKLTELGKFLEIDEGNLQKFAQKLFANNSTKAHDARYDTTLTYLAWKKALELGQISTERFNIRDLDKYVNPIYIKKDIEKYNLKEENLKVETSVGALSKTKASKHTFLPNV